MFTSIIMVAVCEEGTSFLEKTDRVPMFLLKYVFLEAVASDNVWYFSPVFLDEKAVQEIADMGYQITANYGDQQLGKYPFLLYHFERPQEPAESQDSLK